MNAGPFTVSPPISIVIIDNRDIISVISSMMYNSVSGHIRTGRGIAEPNPNKGEYDQNRHQSKTAEPSYGKESFGGFSWLVCLRCISLIDQYENLLSITVFIHYLNNTRFLGKGEECCRAIIPTIKNPGGYLTRVIRRVEIGDSKYRLTIIFGHQILAIGVMEHCFCPISGSIWTAQSNGECLKLTGFRIGVIDWYRVSNLIVSFHNFQASV